MPHDPLTHRNPGPRVWALLALTLTLSLAACNNEQANAQAAQQEPHAQRLAKAKALFAERCKTAGVAIKRTVKDVEGIELAKIRPKLEYADRRYFDPMFEGAAMAGEVGGENYIKQFLMYEKRATHSPAVRGSLGPPTSPNRHQQLSPTPGYRFVEVVEADSTRYRYSPTWTPGQSNWVDGQHKREPVKASSTRYALDYEDIVNPADRAYWVAGTKLRVIDKQNGEVIAELTIFVFDPGFGEALTGRWPWQHAGMRVEQQCPMDPLQPTGKASRYFVDTVLIPKQGD